MPFLTVHPAILSTVYYGGYDKVVVVVATSFAQTINHSSNVAAEVYKAVINRTSV